MQMSPEKSEEEAKDMEPIIVMYLGAGRGPLIPRTLSAAKKAKVPVKIIAVEKNPNAVITLRNMIADQNLGSQVTLFNGDMRHLEMEKKGDIIISELLGSFGDNELSPECLYPTEKFLKPEGIYLPYDYTSFLVPLSSQILWNEVFLYSSQGASARIPLSQQLNAFELPYVVRIHSASFPCGKSPKPVFTFEHFGKNNKPAHPKVDLKVFKKVSFVVQHEVSEFHGFAGYFDAHIYQEVFYSTNTDTHTPGMHSWFPLYFPIKHPVTAYKGQEVRISMWRCVSTSKVWYEWSFEVYDPVTKREVYTSYIHNVDGKGHAIGL